MRIDYIIQTIVAPTAMREDSKVQYGDFSLNNIIKYTEEQFEEVKALL